MKEEMYGLMKNWVSLILTREEKEVLYRLFFSPINKLKKKRCCLRTRRHHGCYSRLRRMLH